MRENNMRKLSTTFLNCLRSGFLSEITECVRRDPDLNLEIRDGYINIYYKGNSLLRLAEAGSPLYYKVDIHRKFSEGIRLPPDLTKSGIPQFIENIPLLKENITRYGRRSLELEYEQMIIRANNFEPRNNTEYFVVDRQYAVKEGRFDLTGIHWARNGRQTNREASVCLLEVKFGPNQDIQFVHQQLARYYEPIRNNAAGIAEEMETIFRQKLALRLYSQPVERLNAMKTLRFSRDIHDFQFILVLVDYNHNSRFLRSALAKIKQLPFADQVKVFFSGFGMWAQNVKELTRLTDTTLKADSKLANRSGDILL